jgi:hypothetical protein
MRQLLSLVLTFAILTRLAPASPDLQSMTTQIIAIPLGASIELHLKTNEKMRGSRGAVSDTGFMLLDAQAVEHPIKFEDVASVKLYKAKSHTTRNILIGAGIALAAVGIWIGITLRCGPFGCK